MKNNNPSEPNNKSKSLGLWGKFSVFLIIVGTIYGASHFYSSDSKPKAMSEYDIRKGYRSAVFSIYGSVSGIQSTCANPDLAGAMSEFSARDVLLMDANSVVSDLQDITVLSEQFEKFDPKLNSELNDSFKKSEALSQGVLTTKKCPKDTAAFDFLKRFGEQYTKVFPCQGIC